MYGYQIKFSNYQKALERLKDGLSRLDKNDDLSRDGIIQRFEFTFELAWKTLKSIFEDEGIIGLNSPKSVLREAFSARIIEDDESWLAMLADRNSTSHIYDERQASEICDRIREKHILVLVELKVKIEAILKR